MKNNLLISIAVTFFFLIFGCAKPYTGFLAEVSQLKSAEGAVKKIINENQHIDFDADFLSKKFNNTSTTKLADDYKDDIALIKAALYRFYSHVSIVNGKYHYDLQSPQQINLSERVYSFLTQDIERINSLIDKARENEEEVVLGEIDADYLNSLLE